ncbi:MAG: glycine cleavage system protein GcvH [Chloroflexi bacterium]|nr:glycine cleavage system protein GcvH [Chloroflexota bacterium]
MNPPDCRYSREHEWVRLEPGGTAQVGITDFAQQELGDVVFLTLPQAGETLAQFHKFGEIESVKAVSDLYAPISGEVVEVNSGVAEHPELVNQEPYVRGWLLRIRVTDKNELDNLLSANDYEALVALKGQH